MSPLLPTFFGVFGELVGGENTESALKAPIKALTEVTTFFPEVNFVLRFREGDPGKEVLPAPLLGRLAGSGPN